MNRVGCEKSALHPPLPMVLRQMALATCQSFKDDNGQKLEWKQTAVTSSPIGRRV